LLRYDDDGCAHGCGQRYASLQVVVVVVVVVVVAVTPNYLRQASQNLGKY
jgi:hypothetical protein